MNPLAACVCGQFDVMVVRLSYVKSIQAFNFSPLLSDRKPYPRRQLERTLALIRLASWLVS